MGGWRQKRQQSRDSLKHKSARGGDNEDHRDIGVSNAEKNENGG